MSPKEITRTSWSGVFGMCEMEEASKIILAKAQLVGAWLPCYAFDFGGDATCLDGFVELVSRGWLKKTKECYNGGFMPTADFVNRIAGS